jgi:N-acetyl-gamma-glutamyl-phosphate reductase
MSKPKVFIDGEAGTTGLEIRNRLNNRQDIDVISIHPELRKDTAERKRLLNECDLGVLCLPDEAARESVRLITNPHVRILDASTAHRVSPDWVYGFPELAPEQGDHIRKARHVSNPGCYATGALALIAPLTSSGIIPAEYHITITAISGYSGGGKELIALCENSEVNLRKAPYCLYGLDQKHKHLPEIRIHGGLIHDPIFLPSYSDAFYRGMLIQIPLRLKDLKRETGMEINGHMIHEALAKHYIRHQFIKILPLQSEVDKHYILTPLSQNETNNIEIRTFWNSEKEIVILTACLDNLGKGAAGAAVQNIDIMLDLR